MPIYKQDDTGRFVPFEPTPFPDLEKTLEDWIELNPHLIIEGERLAIIGRQPRTGFNKALDLLAVDETGASVVIELKRGETPRDVVAQSLEYAAWVDSLSLDQLDEIARQHARRRGVEADGLDALYRVTFAEDEGEVEDDGDDTTTTRITFNNRQRIVVIAERISEEVEQTLRYLRTRFGADVYGVAFSVHVAGTETIISTTTVVGRERSKPPTSNAPGHQESVEETFERVQSDFLRRALPDLEEWAREIDGMSIGRAARGSTRRVGYKGTRWLYYYFAANWMYVLLFRISAGELQLLRERLTDPSTIEPRRGGLHSRFHVKNESDLALLKEIILARVASTTRQITSA